MTDDEQFMIECITTELTEYVMRDYHIGMKEALDMVYNSETYSKLIDRCMMSLRKSKPLTEKRVK